MTMPIWGWMQAADSSVTEHDTTAVKASRFSPSADR
jgi:hypothetical protein